MDNLISVKGKYYELAIINLLVSAIKYDGAIHLYFNDMYLRFNLYIIWNQYNYKKIIRVSDKEAYEKMFDLFLIRVVSALIDKEGNMYLKFENGIELEISDEARVDINPHCEYWHFIGGDKLLAYDQFGETVIIK